MKFGQLILSKITKIVAISCRILRLVKCTKFTSAGAPPETPLGELTALPRPLAEFKGPSSKAMGGRDRGVEGKGNPEGKGRNREEEERARGGGGREREERR